MTRKTFISIIFLVTHLMGCGEQKGIDRSVSADFNFDPTFQAQENDINASVFISGIDALNVDTTKVERISFSITPKPGSKSKAISASYTLDFLNREGFVRKTNGNIITIPIFGLYQSYENIVNIFFEFTDGSNFSFTKFITTDQFMDSNHIYDNILEVVKPQRNIGFNFFAMKNFYHPPIVLDIDGNIRWALEIATNSYSSIFSGKGFYVGSSNSLEITNFSLLGTTKKITVSCNSINSNGGKFHHNIEKGKNGFLIELDGTINGVSKIESYIAEVDDNGVCINEWDIGNLLKEYMVSEGDDPSEFIRDGFDWFHLNSSIYDPSDDTIIASSRENFIIKFEYNTGKIHWILGDETKYWFRYPSLQKLSRTINGGEKPIGQHALSIVKNNKFMFFNNGQASFNQPIGAPVGVRLNSSIAEIISVNDNQDFQVEWQFDDDIYSDICSSVYEESNSGDLLVNYAAADGRKKLILIGITKNKEKLFEYHLNSPLPCSTSWNSQLINLESIKFI